MSRQYDKAAFAQGAEGLVVQRAREWRSARLIACNDPHRLARWTALGAAETALSEAVRDLPPPPAGKPTTTEKT